MTTNKITIIEEIGSVKQTTVLEGEFASLYYYDVIFNQPHASELMAGTKSDADDMEPPEEYDSNATTDEENTATKNSAVERDGVSKPQFVIGRTYNCYRPVHIKDDGCHYPSDLNEDGKVYISEYSGAKNNPFDGMVAEGVVKSGMPNSDVLKVKITETYPVVHGFDEHRVFYRNPLPYVGGYFRCCAMNFITNGAAVRIDKCLDVYDANFAPAELKYIADGVAQETADIDEYVTVKITEIYPLDM